MVKILITEDSSVIQKMLKGILEKEKTFEIVGISSDGEDACLKVEQLKPDVILMDVRMPKMTGVEAIKKIMSENPTPIIVLTSVEPVSDIKSEVLKYGAVSFMEKPKALDYSSIASKLINEIKILSRLKLSKRVF